MPWVHASLFQQRTDIITMCSKEMPYIPTKFLYSFILFLFLSIMPVCLTEDAMPWKALDTILRSKGKNRMREVLTSVDYKHTKESCADDGENITMVYKRPWEYERLVRYEITILDQYQKESIYNYAWTVWSPAEKEKSCCVITPASWVPNQNELSI